MYSALTSKYSKWGEFSIHIYKFAFYGETAFRNPAVLPVLVYPTKRHNIYPTRQAASWRERGRVPFQKNQPDDNPAVPQKLITHTRATEELTHHTQSAHTPHGRMLSDLGTTNRPLLRTKWGFTTTGERLGKPSR